jgi:hypothetical protein
VRSKAEAATDQKARAELLLLADVWERMARWEEWHADQPEAPGKK